MYTSHTQLSLSEKISYSIRKRINIQYQKYNSATNKMEPPVSMRIAASKCECTDKHIDPKCRNKFAYTIDYVDKQKIQLRECPNRFDDRKLWSQIYVVLQQIKDWSNIYNHYKIPTIQLPTHLYDFIESVFQAKTRYLNQKEESEK